MEEHVFNSTNVRRGRYYPETRTLEIDFAHGRTFPPVTGVSPERWRQFKNASSPGAFVNEHFRGRR